MTANDSSSDSIHSAASLFAQLYTQLRAEAQRQMAQERRNHTLTATALVHEAWLRLHGPRDVPFEKRGHFYKAAIEAMQRVLLDHAKARGRQKRGGGMIRHDLDAPFDIGREEHLEDYLALDEAIGALAKVEPRMAEMVQLRYFAGLTGEEIAAVLQVSERTVKGDWKFARAWLRRYLEREG